MAAIIQLPSAAPSGVLASAGRASRCAMSGNCGTGASPGDGIPSEVLDLVKAHPCYSGEAHHHFARVHLAVAPACNIQCNYCNRKYDCANESRPGVTSARLTPEQALRKAVAVARAVPQLSVVGIAGPGDACHDWRRTRETFELVSRALPGISLCLSTNGLALPDHAAEIVALGIRHVTVTINIVDPEVGARIHPWIHFRNRRWTGADASRILHERQMESLDLLAAAKIPVKVNPVMIPGINDAHLAEVSRVVKEKGAFLHNIMPLISDHAHGTAFGLAGQRGPAGAELAALQDRLGGGARLMRHCRQCRADAAGMLGEDRGQDFTADGGPEEDGCDPAPREAYRAVAIGTIDAHRLARSAANARLATMPDAPAVTVAIATRGGGRINRHFGHAREFQVYAVSPAGVTLEGIRKVDHYCQGGWGDGASLDATVAALDGVAAVLCARVGTCPRESMPAAGIPVSDGHAYGWIEEGIAAWYMAAFPSAVRRLA